MLQIVDLYWDYEEKSNKYFQKISLFDSENSEIKNFSLKDYVFNYKLSSERYCCGWSDNKGYNVCPYKNVLYEGSFKRCKLCEDSLGFKASFFLNGEPNEYMSNLLKLEHWVYLAYFPNNIIKVGTAVFYRKFVRLIEQDARGFVFIAKTDGFNVQKIERYISNNFGLTESVKSSTKLKSISERPSKDSMVFSLTTKYKSIYTKLKNNVLFSDILLNPEEFKVHVLTDLQEIYYPITSINRYKLNDVENYLIGSFLGLRGKYLFVKNFNKVVFFDINDLAGRFIIDYKSNFEYSSLDNSGKLSFL